jgi:predicted enzyme related to lactoylglutathione lyase
MPRVTHFEINADDPVGLVDFYKGVFGWKITKWEGPVDYWLVSTGDESEPGINGAIMNRMDPPETTINTIEVISLDDLLEKIVTKGGEIVKGKIAVPGVGYMAYCKDPQGNTFGLMQNDPDAS